MKNKQYYAVLMTAFLWASIVVCGRASADGDFIWPTDWQAFGPVPPSEAMLAGGLPPADYLVPGEYFKTIPGRLSVDEVYYTGRPFEFTGGVLDLAELFGGTERGKTIYLAARLTVDQAANYTVNAGANWWMRWWINGEQVFDTIPQGNRVSPIAVANYEFTLDLETGEHVLAVAVISGSGGFNLAAGGPREVQAEADAAAAGPATFRAAYDHARNLLADRSGSSPLRGPGMIDFPAIREAFARARDLAENDNDRAMAILNLADCKLLDVQWSDLDSAYTDYMTVLESDAPADQRARAAIGVGETRVFENAYQQAREYFARATELSYNPDIVAGAQFGRARSFMQERNYVGALDEFDSLLGMENLPGQMRHEVEACRTGIKMLAALRADRPRMFFNADTWPAVKARSLAGQKEALDAMRRDMASLELAEIRADDWGMRAMRAALVWWVDGDEAVFDKVTGMLSATLDGWQAGAGDSRYYSRAAYAAALDWMWNDLPVAQRLDLAREFIDYAWQLYNGQKIRGNLDRPGYYYLPNMYLYAGLATLDPALDDLDYMRALTIAGFGYYRNWSMWTDSALGVSLSYLEQARDDGGSGAFAVGRLIYEYAETPTPVWSFMHCVQSALDEDIPSILVYLGITPHHVLRNILDITGSQIRIFGFSRDWRWPGGTMRADLLYDHLGQFIHFFKATHPLEAGIARHLRERLENEGRPGAGQFPVYPFLLNLEDAPPAGIPDNMPLARHFESRGKVLMSSGFGPDDTYILFSCGGGTSHWVGHYDATHFTIYKKGFLALDTGSRAHPGFYTYNSIAHNCVLIRNPERTVVFDGEQVPHTGGQDNRRALARVLAFESRPEYAYVATDATPTYNSEDCAQMVRQFVFLPQDYVLVFDRVKSVKAEYPKTWLFQTANEPVLHGSEFYADQDQGRIFCRTLLPADAVLEKVGGLGKEFWASGRNWPIPDNSPHKSRLMNPDGSVPEVHGHWRVEISPGEARQTDYFLHLIQTADQDVETMVAAETVENADEVAVNFTAGTREYTLQFNKTGVVGGSIRINKGDRVVVDKKLIRQIMPQSGLALDGEPVWGSEYAVALNLDDLRQPDALDILKDDPRSAAMINLAGVGGFSAVGQACLKWDKHCGDTACPCRFSSKCRAVAGLIEALSDPQAGIIRRAVWALGEIGCPAAVESLAAALKSDNGRVRSAAVTALSCIAVQADCEGALDALIAGLSDDYPPVLRRRIADALGYTGAPAGIEPLISILGQDTDPEMRAAAAAALGVVSFPEAVEPLMAALEDADWRVRRQAAAALIGVGSPAVPALVKALDAADTTMQAKAVQALKSIGAPAFDALLPALESVNPWIRANAAAALSVPSGDRRALPLLLELTRDGDMEVRANAMRALGRVGGNEVVAVLTAGLRDASPAVRQSAAVALANVGDELPVPELIAALNDDTAAVRGAVARALGVSGAPAALDPLIAALQDPDENVRMTAAAALGELGDERAVPALIDAMNDDYHGVGYAANDALCIITGHRVVIPLGWSGAYIRQYRLPHWVKWQENVK